MPARPLSVFEIFRLGIGPSSSHTVGPMRAARHFTSELALVCGVVEADSGAEVADFGAEVADSVAPAENVRPARILTELMGSLGATGHGHSTDRAVVLGLAGYEPETVPLAAVKGIIDDVAATGVIDIPSVGPVPFVLERDMQFVPRVILPYHANGMTMRALAASGEVMLERTYYSVGGGFVMQELGDPLRSPEAVPLGGGAAASAEVPVPYPYGNGAELMAQCHRNGLRVSDVVLANEMAARPHADVIAYVDRVWQAMQDCIDAGCEQEGYLPGMLWVERRAKRLHTQLRQRGSVSDPMSGMDWVNLYALAVNEENAAGHRVVTAPTNGAAGVVPAVLKYFCEFVEPAVSAPGSSEPHGGVFAADGPRVANGGGAGVVGAGVVVGDGAVSVDDSGSGTAGGSVGIVSGSAGNAVGDGVGVGDGAPMVGNDAPMGGTGSGSTGEDPELSHVHRFLLTAAAIGGLIKTNASIAGAEVGCQGEVGSASAMAAAGLADALGGDPLQVENAAEIAMEHSLGLTCDPVGGLVQIPCIERNAIAAVKAINAARMALWGDGRHMVSFDAVVETMRETGADMHNKYKETSEGGLAVHIVEC